MCTYNRIFRLKRSPLFLLTAPVANSFLYQFDTKINNTIPTAAKAVKPKEPICPSGTKINAVKIGARELPVFPPT